MSTTDELRRMLDERGIEWNYGMRGPSFSTEIGTAGNKVTFIEVAWGLLCSTYLRPEQVADMFASFGPSKEGCGRETCHMVLRHDHVVYGEAPCIWLECDECGGVLPNAFGIAVSYCPNCGRKVVEL